ncbi:MAG: hypothetical protein A2005_05395 [Desulfuromonadales bacterium GWC2_61_20]|nr:MAG: hypothetical protein A2005_05395 [Desulfuromonadales bacterium GWC2_61_20]
MRDDPSTQLHSVYSLFQTRRTRDPRLFPAVLAALRDIFPAAAPSLVLYAIRGHRSGHRLISPDGPSPCTETAAFTPRHSDFVSGEPLVRDGVLYLPVPSAGRPQGFLSLRISTPQPSVLSGLRFIAQLVATELHSQQLHEEESFRLLLVELGHTLAASTDSDRLLADAANLLLQRGVGFCIVVRRLHDDTIFSPPAAYCTARSVHVEKRCLLLEPRLALTVATSGKPLMRKCKIEALHPGGRPSSQLAFPLTRARKTFGCITFFLSSAEHTSLHHLQQQLTFFCDKITAELERLTLGARLESLSLAYNQRQAENSTLFRISRALHTIPRMNELTHFILAAATSQGGGGFERSMVFLANAKSDKLQGMLGLTSETAELTLPPALGLRAWENPLLDLDVQTRQRRAPFCRAVMKQRLDLDGDTPVARAFRRNRIVLVSRPELESPEAIALAEDLALGPYACAPLAGASRVLGVLVVANPQSRTAIPTERLRFLEIFISLAGAALENAMLVRQLESACLNLQEAQDRLLQGERLALLGEMAATVAHELKTPLVAIGGFARRLSRSAATREQVDCASIIVREIERMESLLAGVLTFSKKQLLCFSSCDLNSLITKALQLDEPILAENSVSITRRLSPELPQIPADEHKLTQVFLNLFANARQAMPNGGNLTVISRKGLFKGKNGIAIEVEDSGGGIPQHLVPQIFNPFFSTKEEGTGLGLAISAQIIEHHRGEIEVFNRAQGAVFIIHLPLD